MLKIIYREDGEAYSDFNLIGKAQKIIELYRSGIDIFFISTDNIILALRALVCRGKLSPHEICFQYEDELITMNEITELSSHPKGFCDHDIEFLREIVKYKCKKIKE